MTDSGPERETKAILDAIRCVGGDRGLVYVTVPITTGLREYVLMRDLGCDRNGLRTTYRDRWISEVVAPNEADAEAFTRMIQIAYPAKLVLNPAMMNIETWGQREYTTMWNQVLVEFCDELVVTPDWPYSSGAIGEVREMAMLGRQVIDVLGKRVTNQQLVEAASRARQNLVSMGFSDEELTGQLPELSLPERRSQSIRQAPNLEWDTAITWLLRESRAAANFGRYDDDGRTREEGPHLRLGKWKARLEKYLTKARDLGVNTNDGGIALAQYVVVCIALMGSVWRIFGPFPEPGHSRTVLKVSRLPESNGLDTDVLALVVAWLRREYFYTSNKYDPRDDDDHTRSSSVDEYWWRQLDWYYGLVTREGLDSFQGRQYLGKFVSTAMNFLVSRIRTFGDVGQPTRPPIQGLFD